MLLLCKLPLQADPWKEGAHENVVDGVSLLREHQCTFVTKTGLEIVLATEKKLLKPLGMSNVSCLWVLNFSSSFVCAGTGRWGFVQQCCLAQCRCQPPLPGSRVGAVLPGWVSLANEAVPGEPCHGHPTACLTQCQAFTLKKPTVPGLRTCLNVSAAWGTRNGTAPSPTLSPSRCFGIESWALQGGDQGGWFGIGGILTIAIDNRSLLS